MRNKNIERQAGFNQVCVWPATIVGLVKAREFEEYFLNEMGVRVQYLEEILTKPDTNDFGDPIPETGGRNDVFFAVHEEDVGKFALPRLAMGISWIEDAIASANGGNRLYPARVKKYKTW